MNRRSNRKQKSRLTEAIKSKHGKNGGNKYKSKNTISGRTRKTPTETNPTACPVSNHVPVAIDSQKQNCPICFKILSGAVEVMSTICGHIFCKRCIERVVKTNMICSNCKQVVKTDKRCPICRTVLTQRKIHKIYL